ncbi:ubiquitin carboxyl-terminal hydrolase 14 [Octopus bimaculoides]|uniref:Ubiquitin carboxyl-terminal hydrolase n=1 Tax=Octopus bimaculoides TaxID=37653 RepID=A0A0L8G2H5_OCTBM|nr:ubiquitin carboxyl-terminal hydrolase 14 [Octopus bimaculoides]|eukprot:XP_014784803.1 PREDICTED: ubiquitin carboxyl-terminal hydrolase 14-like [Octopus bimaculoides]
MPTYKVHVKWGKEKFNDIECDADETPIQFKAQLFALTGVQPSRQKVLTKGVILKDEDWGNVKLKDGITFLMMGSADALPAEPTEKTVFLEDMNEQELATALELPPGLSNLGNTCYMNATLQCLRAIPELKECLKSHPRNRNTTPAGSITRAMQDLFNLMNLESTAISPLFFLNVLQMTFPRFAEKGEQGLFMQQDANECWTEVVRCLQQSLTHSMVDQPSEASEESVASSSKKFIDLFMGGEFEVVMKCSEMTDEDVSKSVEKFYQLSCFIEKEVRYMQAGLKSGLEETITKFSPSLGRDAQYTKSSKISRLPGYLSIQFVRFFYKEKESINAKILKDVKFPLNLDVYDLCTEELQKKLVPTRDKYKIMEDRKAEEQSKAKYDKEYAKTLEARKLKTEAYSFSGDEGSNNSGFYELKAVLTHKGRSSSSGHYVAWIRKKGDEWIMFDDDKVSPILSEDILKLSGGGDWHCAYVLLYGPRPLQLEEM